MTRSRLSGHTEIMKNLFSRHWKATAIWSLAAVALVLSPLLLYTLKPAPPGFDIEAAHVPTPPGDIRLLIDDTAWDPTAGKRVFNQEIFDEILAMIGRADRFLFLDMFLWNPWKGSVPGEHRKLSTELAEALIQRKQEIPDLDIIVLSDPINRIYGSSQPGFFKDLFQSGIPVVSTDLTFLSDSNRIYAPYWSILEKVLNSPMFKKWAGAPRLSNPFETGGPEISILQFGRMLRFNANHRKVVVAGSSKTGLEMLIGSLNPADGSSAHSNMALHVRGRSVLEILHSELEVLRWSLEGQNNLITGTTDALLFKAESVRRQAVGLTGGTAAAPGWPEVKVLTEGAVGRSLVSLFEGTSMGDEVRIALFYLSQREIVEAIKKAVERGVTIRLILDANRDAFGMRKIGIPNRPVAAELMKLSDEHDISVRWADTHGEQFHTKSASIIYRHSGNSVFITGSANWTRRNIGNFNLEADLLLDNAPHITEAFNRYFDTLWDNSDGLSHTLPYEDWQENGLKRFIKTGVYRFQERWGAGTF